ncbi:MAG: 2-hydroxyacyl-CoA dehydratase [Dehalococcoidales bacterium]|nr:2-hydroxyacyl-CoA dehydratase [Dehalococcoidales bacterium]
MKEFLGLCGFNEKEIELELPRVEKAFTKLGITASDIEQGKLRLKTYYAIELEGVRKIIRLVLRECINSLLVKDEGVEKIIYGFMCPGIDLISSALACKSRKVYAIHHSWALHIVVGCILGKLEGILEAAEEKWLKAGIVSHCANVKTLVGPVMLGLFPKPDLLITSGFLCETAPKTLDLLYELYNIPVRYIDAPPDRELGEYSLPNDRVAPMAALSMRKVVQAVQEIVGFEISDDLLTEVLEARNRQEAVMGRIKAVIENSNPLPLSPALENIWTCLGALPLNIDGIEEATEALSTLYIELQERVARGIGVVEKDAPRVMAILPMGQTDPRLEQLACEVGIAIVATDQSVVMPPLGTSDDPYVKYFIARLNGSMGLPLKKRVPLIVEGCRKLNIDGVLDRYHVGCRSVAADALLIESAVKRELGIPVLLLEWESFDPRVFNLNEYKKRLEIFKTMMLEKKNKT